ncbi:hypothetical protein LMG28614_07293 [Paraburkholderia ultramafica]|uniref:Uncharacterized protein n=1 Tax=Paraburkholderia ultramafica TaxID=1544867 RepID=A0A6S7CJ40_9BURK|nr:hypothetical protein LMG28614_07293 [Paraburkholderia ultramafica]
MPVARCLQPVERLEHRVQRFSRDARPAVEHADRGLSIVHRCDADLGRAAKLQRIVDEVADDAAQRLRPRHHRPTEAAFQRHLLARVDIVADQAVEQRIRIDAARHLGCAVHRPRVRHAFFHQRFHLLQILSELRALRVVVHHVDAQAHPCDRRLQIVRDRRQDLHALGHVGRDPVLHRVERARGPRHFRRSTFRQTVRLQVRAQRIGRQRQLMQRTGRQPHRQPAARREHDQLQQQHQRQPARQRRARHRAQIDRQRCAVAQLQMNLQAFALAGDRVHRQRITRADAVADGLRDPLRQARIDRRASNAGPEDELIAAPCETRQPLGALLGRQMIEQRHRTGDLASDVTRHHVGHRLVAFGHREPERQRLRERQPDEQDHREPREQGTRPVWPVRP